MDSKKTITGGLYLVANPAMQDDELLKKIKQAVAGGVRVIQIWNNWPDHFDHQDKKVLIDKILNLVERWGIPVLINEAYELLAETGLHGVHFDQIPAAFDQIRTQLNDQHLLGLTCGNDRSTALWAEKHEFDYISFCSMFPSRSVDSCDIVNPEMVKEVRSVTKLPIFLSGGITVNNLKQFAHLDFDGVAVISGLLEDENPKQQAQKYQKILDEIINQ